MPKPLNHKPPAKPGTGPDYTLSDDDRRDIIFAIVLILVSTAVFLLEGFEWSDATPFLMPLPIALLISQLGAALLLLRVIRRKR